MSSPALRPQSDSPYASIFADLCAIMGEAATRALLAAHGGTRLYIPETMTAEHPITILIGTAAADALSKAYGRERIVLPLGAPGEHTKRHQIEGLLKTTSMTYPEIARAALTTLRWVEMVASDIKNQDQMNLFED